MTTAADPFVVDSDAHVLEPPDLWETYLEDRYKDRAIKIVAKDGAEQLIIDKLKRKLKGEHGDPPPRPKKPKKKPKKDKPDDDGDKKPDDDKDKSDKDKGEGDKD